MKKTLSATSPSTPELLGIVFDKSSDRSKVDASPVSSPSGSQAAIAMTPLQQSMQALDIGAKPPLSPRLKRSAARLATTSALSNDAQQIEQLSDSSPRSVLSAARLSDTPLP